MLIYNYGSKNNFVRGIIMKGKTHVYMANLIIRDLEKGNIALPRGLGSFAPPQEIKAAILNNKKEFRAGATGPDFYPDVQIGQTIVHPQDSGFWLELMFEEFAKIPSADPERARALSFLMGFMMHYSTDLYGHESVNKWARGWFPSFDEALTQPEKMKIIVRHMLVEAYMDKKVPNTFDITLAIPHSYLKSCFLNEKALNKYTNITGLKYAEEMRLYAFNKSQDSTTNMIDVFNYFKSWEQDLSRGINEWFNTWHTVNEDMIYEGKSLTDAKEALSNWVSNYFAYMTPAPDMIIDFAKLLDKLNIFKPIKDMIVQKVKDYLNALVKAATGIDVQDAIEEFKKMMKQPELYLNSGILYSETNITEQLDKEFGNLGCTNDTLNQTYHAFYQCLNMGKLCLLGPDNLNNLIRNAKGNVADVFKNQICTGSIDTLAVRLKTAGRSWGNMTSGTDDNVYFGVGLKNGQYMEMLFDKPGYNDFEAGDNDTYSFILPRRVQYNEISFFKLRKDYINISDDWTLQDMTVRDQLGRVLLDKSINHTLVDREPYVINLNIDNMAENSVLQMDCKVMSFLYSLDGMGKNDNSNPTQYKQWTDDKNIFYSDAVLREKVYKPLFEMPTEGIIHDDQGAESGRLEVFARGSDKALHHIWQVAPNSGWSSWGSLGGTIDIVKVGLNQDGRLEAFARGTDNALWNIWQVAPNSGWSNWNSLGGWIDSIEVAQNADGRLEVFGRGSDKALWHNWQVAPNSGWSGWQSMGGWIDMHKVSRNEDGRLEVFARGSDKALHHIWQVAPNSGWSDWQSLGGWIDDLDVGQNADGRLEVFARGSDKALYHIWQVAPNSGWSGWSSLGGWIDMLCVGKNADGRLEVFARGSDQALYNIWQVAPNSGWSSWNSLGGWIDMLCVGKNADGRLEVFARGSDKALYNIWQVTPNGGWSNWNSLGGWIDMLAVGRNGF